MQTTTNQPAAPPVESRSTKGLRIVLGLIGLFVAVSGLNIALGGITTLGWEGRSDFVTVADQGDFDVQDNHIRFLGGVWVGLGLAYLAAARWLHQLRMTVVVFSGLLFVGGLARLSSGSLSLVLSGSIVGSITAELVFAPLLAWWTLRATRPSEPR